LKLGKLTPDMSKTLEFRIEKVIDKQIQNALNSTLTDKDWQVYKTYVSEHPDAPKEDALDAMISNRPELQETLEGALHTSYNKMMMIGDAIDLANATADEAEPEA